MVAGAVAGISEHITMFPVDTIKTRMQALGHPGQRVSTQLLCGPLRDLRASILWFRHGLCSFMLVTLFDTLLDTLSAWCTVPDLLPTMVAECF